MSGILQGLIGSLKSAASSTTDAFFNLVTLLLNTTSTNGAQNNTFLDSSSNNFSITRNGNPTQGTFTPFSQAPGYWSNYFTGGYLRTTSSTAAGFSTNPFTVEAWVYMLDRSAQYYLFGGSGVSMQVSIKTDGTLVLGVPGVGDITASTGTVPLNAWTHIAYVRSSTSAGGFAYYINGVASGTATLATDLGTASATVEVGTTNTGAGVTSWTGYISNMRAVKGTAVYTAAFTPSTVPLTAIANTSMLTCQSNQFVDNSSANATFTTANASVQAFSPFLPTAAYSTSVVGGGYYGDGSGDAVYFQDTTQSGTSSSFNLGASNNASVDHWWYPTAAQSTAGFSKQVSAPTDWNGQIWYQVNLYDSGNISLFYRGGANFQYIFSALPANFLNQWNHVAVASDTSNNLSIFFNGVRVATTVTTIGLSSTTPNYITFGQQAAGQTASSLKGYMSGLRFIQGSGAYNAASTTITVPTAPPTSTGTTQLLLSCTNAGIYDAAAKNDLETVGTAQVSTTQAKFGTTSMYFAGSGNYLLTPYSPTLVFGTADFTFECQLYWTGGNSENTLIMNNASGGFAIKLQATTATNWALENSYVGQVADFGTAPTKNVWHHIAVTRASGTLYAFIDGTQVFSGANSTNFTNTASWYIAGNGASTSLYITGYIDDLRITKGYARYTASFTPPTAAFPLQ
jgi:hypothetical protein